ncbi:MAG: CSLREA domain-containing protein, partial [Verrucomicrobiota bacterium]
TDNISEAGYGAVAIENYFGDADLFQFHLFDCNISRNVGLGGMSVLARRDTEVIMTRCTMTNNVATNYGGGVTIFDCEPTFIMEDSLVENNVSHTNGGGFYVGAAAEGDIMIRRSLVAGNIASNDGGGLYLDGEVTLENTTVSGNRSSDEGGGIYHVDGSVLLRHTTVFQNQSDTGSSGIRAGLLPLNLSHTIVGGSNTGAVYSLGYNLLEDTNGVTFTGLLNLPIYSGSSLLSPLADHGGPTWTHAVPSNSPAFNAGNLFSTQLPDSDQRGLPRVRGLAIDLGAYELQAEDPDIGDFPATPSGTVINVTSPDDIVNPADGILTLREAISLANTATNPIEIQIPAGTYPLTLFGPEDDLNQAGDLDVLLTNIVFTGISSNRPVIDGLKTDRVFDFPMGHVSAVFQNLEIRNGYAVDAGPELAHGGGIRVLGLSNRVSLIDALVASNCTMTNLLNFGDGGGLYCESGSLRMSNTVFRGNLSSRYGGGFALMGGEATIDDSIIAENNCWEQGGGVYGHSSDFYLSGVSVLSNLSIRSGAGLYIRETNSSTRGTSVLENCTLAWNVIDPDDHNAGGGGFLTLYQDVYVSNSLIHANSGGGF